MDKKKLAVIHIVKKQLGLSDEEYRAILRDATGVETAKDLDDAKLRRRVAALRLGVLLPYSPREGGSGGIISAGGRGH